MSVSVCVCLSVLDHVFGTTHPIFTSAHAAVGLAINWVQQYQSQAN